MTSKCTAKKRSRKCLTLNDKLEIIKFSEENANMSVAEIGRRLGLARPTVSTILHAKNKVLKEIKNDTPGHTKLIRKRDSLIADMEKVLLVWIEEEMNNKMPLSEDMIQEQAHNLFHVMKAKKGKEAADDNFKASNGWFKRFKERSCLFKITTNSETSGVDTERKTNAVFWKMIPAKTSIIVDKTKCGIKALNLEALDVAEILDSQDETLTDQEENYYFDSFEEDNDIVISELEQAINCIKLGMAAFEAVDPNFERSSTVNASLLNDIACYQEIIRKRRQPNSTIIPHKTTCDAVQSTNVDNVPTIIKPGVVETDIIAYCSVIKTENL